MSDASGKRKKSWHESKRLRKRAAFLLNDPDLIPTDVCFRIRTEDRKIKEVHGHKIFFALASPVFHAELYGSIKEQGNVEITDVSIEAFLCLRKYIYTDSFDGVSVANMIDVLAASKKYLMAKLTRYCYGFIQNHITAENCISLWGQAYEAFEDVVAKQCIAEIGRNTTKAVLTDDFLNISQDQLLELTSWQKLTIDELDLFRAVKKWKTNQENTTGALVSGSGNDVDVFQNIRRDLLGRKQPSAGGHFSAEEGFSAEDVTEIFGTCNKNARKRVRTIGPRIRDPAPASFELCIKYFVSNKFDEPADMEWKMVGCVNLLIWADVAPKACQLLRRHVENDFNFYVGQTVRRFGDPDSGVSTCLRKKRGALGFEEAFFRNLSEEERNIEIRNELWPVAGSVLLSVDDSGLDLIILSATEQPLLGVQPNKPPEEGLVSVSYQVPGIVIGKVIGSLPEDLKKLYDFVYATSYEIIADGGEELRFPLGFECSIAEL